MVGERKVLWEGRFKQLVPMQASLVKVEVTRDCWKDEKRNSILE